MSSENRMAPPDSLGSILRHAQLLAELTAFGLEARDANARIPGGYERSKRMLEALRAKWGITNREAWEYVLAFEDPRPVSLRWVETFCYRILARKHGIQAP